MIVRPLLRLRLDIASSAPYSQHTSLTKQKKDKKSLKNPLQEVTKGILSCVDAKEWIVINDKHLEQTVVIGKQLPTNFKRKLQDLLQSNVDVFAWNYADIHRLNEYKHIEPVKQKKRGLALEQNEAVSREVEELLKEDILREVIYQTWVANPVMIKKRDGRWKMCVDFTDINKACPKDCYPLPDINQKVESLSRRNLKAYVDDMVIKSVSKEDMLIDIQETFDKLRAINMKLNPKKCSFGIKEGPFLGHLITKQGIKAASSKVKAISNLTSPKTLKEIQSLNGKLISLSRFLSKGWVAKWAIELGEHDIEFRGCNSIKGQVLADFLAEMPSVEGEDIDTEKCKIPNDESKSEDTWQVYTDGASSSDGSSRQPVIKQYLDKTKEVLKSFNSYSMEHIRRDQNKKSDALSKLASMTFSRLAKEVLVEVLPEKSIAQKEVIDIIKEEGPVQDKSIIKEYTKALAECMWGHDK
ncbi:reverse transcriptase domain-containing protein [Tanacetum coccineum]